MHDGPNIKTLILVILLPRAHAQGGKVIGRVVVVVVVVSTKIVISRDIATRIHNESIEFGEKLASVCTSVTNSAFLLAIVATPIDSAHQCIIPVYIVHTPIVISAHAHN